MINNKQIKIINSMYDSLQFMNNITWNKYRDDIYKYELKQEKQHRNGWCNGRYYGKFTPNLAAKYFTVKHMIDAITAYNKSIYENDNSLLHTVKDYQRIKTSIIMAESFVLNYPDKIETYHKQDIDSALFLEFVKLDYSELAKTEQAA
tara:strand:+ start:256 stop:699 length:444 start_codon:yes stop_codon:yes gene_type:complete